MRHRRKGRTLGRIPSHQRALLRSLASALILTEGEFESDDKGKPKVKGRIITTIQKAKEARPLVERCVTIAICAFAADRSAASELRPSAERGSEEQQRGAHRPRLVQKWNPRSSPVIARCRGDGRCVSGGSKQAGRSSSMKSPRAFTERPGGYTRSCGWPSSRLGDGGIPRHPRARRRPRPQSRAGGPPGV